MSPLDWGIEYVRKNLHDVLRLEFEVNSFIYNELNYNFTHYANLLVRKKINLTHDYLRKCKNVINYIIAARDHNIMFDYNSIYLLTQAVFNATATIVCFADRIVPRQLQHMPGFHMPFWLLGDICGFYACKSGYENEIQQVEAGNYRYNDNTLFTYHNQYPALKNMAGVYSEFDGSGYRLDQRWVFLRTDIPCLTFARKGGAHIQPIVLDKLKFFFTRPQYSGNNIRYIHYSHNFNVIKFFPR